MSGLHGEEGARAIGWGFHGGRPVVWVRKGWKKYKAAILLWRNSGVRVQPFSEKSRTPTVAKECQIGLYDTSEADLALFWNSWSAGLLRERL